MKNILILIITLTALNSCFSQIKQCRDFEKYYYKKKVDLNKKDTWIIKHKYCIVSSEPDSSLNKNEGMLCGTIVDRRTKDRLGASITFNNNKLGVMADSSGYFEIKLSKGLYDAKIRYLGNDILFIDDMKIEPTIKTELMIFLGTTIE